MAGTQQSGPIEPVEALERLGKLSLRELSMEDLLQTVTELTKQVMPGSPEASVCLLVKGRPTTVVSTGRLATELDERQYGEGEGPCLHAARTGELTEVPDTRDDDRWPDYMPHAVEHGALSSLSVPLAVIEDEQVTGALNIYARRPHAFDAESRSVATRFAPYAAVAAGNLHAYESARDLAENLRTALESRAVIDQAKGILMERYKLTADQAFQLLAEASMRSNRKVRDIADTLVRTGDLPRWRAGRPPPAAATTAREVVAARPRRSQPTGGGAALALVPPRTRRAPHPPGRWCERPVSGHEARSGHG